ncbi:sigma-70 family RNA polymerase sigma factor [Oscillospiraceae bacterium OttesenSCG-928-G22]|nr:sigma-70 family RNA polymerase sigma factor [Oscillospiraceae bacterium OttesenSCG-928-G22]
MKNINLRDIYPWYTQDEFIEVTDKVAEELLSGSRYEKSHDRRMRRNKAYSLDVDADMDAAAFACFDDNPEALVLRMEQYCQLCRALNSLPEIQGRRVDAHFLCGMSRKEIAATECVSESSVNESIDRGLRAMKKLLTEYENCPVKCPESDL